MTVVSVDTDYDGLSVTMISQFDAPVDRVWELWTDPRKLERWWGPPSFPATFASHNLVMRSEFTSREDLERWLSTGTREGLAQAIAQMDKLLGL
jgi:hypothetical protein